MPELLRAHWELFVAFLLADGQNYFNLIQLYGRSVLQ